MCVDLCLSGECRCVCVCAHRGGGVGGLICARGGVAVDVCAYGAGCCGGGHCVQMDNSSGGRMGSRLGSGSLQ